MTVRTLKVTRKNNEKVKFKLTVTDGGAKLDLTGQTKLELWFRKPGSATPAVKKTATDQSNATATILQYISEASFLDTVGQWRVSAYVEYGAAGVDGKFESEHAIFAVEDSLDTLVLA